VFSFFFAPPSFLILNSYFLLPLLSPLHAPRSALPFPISALSVSVFSQPFFLSSSVRPILTSAAYFD